MAQEQEGTRLIPVLVPFGRLSGLSALPDDSLTAAATLNGSAWIQTDINNVTSYPIIIHLLYIESCIIVVNKS